MTLSKEKKTEIIKNLEDKLKKAKIIVFVNFHGLGVLSVSRLRKILRENNSQYLVAKKTLIKKVLEDFGYSGDMPNLEGEIAVAYSEKDVIAPARELKKFTKEEKIKLIGGVFENKYINESTVIMLANIPSKEVLLGQFVNIINSPVQGLVGSLNGITRNFVSILDQIKK